jgi:hypothetical protein
MHRILFLKRKQLKVAVGNCDIRVERKISFMNKQNGTKFGKKVEFKFFLDFTAKFQ